MSTACLIPGCPSPSHAILPSTITAICTTCKTARSGLYNGATFTMKQIRENPLRLRGQIGGYYDMLATCAALERESRAAAEAGLMRAPLRTAYHRQVPPDVALLRGDGRSAAIGIGTLTVFNDGDVYRAILAKRSQSTALDSNMFHVLPAMMFEPTTAVFADRARVERQASDLSRDTGRALRLARRIRAKALELFL